LEVSVRQILERLAILLVCVCAAGSSIAHAADVLSGTWSSGPGPAEQTFVFRVQGNAFIGIVCGPCDNPTTVFRITDGRVLDATRVSFSIVHDDGGPLFGKLGPYRDQVSGVLAGTQLTLQTKREGATEVATSSVLTRVLGKRTVASAATAVAAPPVPSAIDGKWVSVGRVAQQNVTLKVRGNKLSGVICGPCDDPDGVFLIEDGVLDGNAISFYIHHIDTPVASVQKNGPGRNFMKGTITGNVMRFTWVREGRESDPGGEMVFIGPIR
jgi:hypothetical protein